MMEQFESGSGYVSLFPGKLTCPCSGDYARGEESACMAGRRTTRQQKDLHSNQKVVY